MRWGVCIGVVVISCCVAGCLGAKRGSRIGWQDPNPPGVVSSFTVFAVGPEPEVGRREVTVRTNEVDLGALMGNAASGRYTIYAFCNGTNGLSSANSKPFYINWTAPVYLPSTNR